MTNQFQNIGQIDCNTIASARRESSKTLSTNTDEVSGLYRFLAATGVREIHCNTMEGMWTGLRNFLRMFRGVSKRYAIQYQAVFEWAHIQTYDA